MNRDKNNVSFLASYKAPDANIVDYWVDLALDKHGGIIKYFNKDLCKWTVILYDPKIVEDLLVWVTCALGTLESTLYKEITEVQNLMKGFEKYVDNSVTNLENKLTNKIDNILKQVTNLNNTINNIESLISEDYINKLVNKLIKENKIDVLDPVQTAINKGTSVTQPMPSVNNKKILLPIWTGTEAEYASLAKVEGMTYNIIDQ